MTPRKEREYAKYYVVADKTQLHKFILNTVSTFMKRRIVPTMTEILNNIMSDSWVRQCITKQRDAETDGDLITIYDIAKIILNHCSYLYHKSQVDEALVSTVYAPPFATPLECAKYINRVKHNEFKNDAEIEQWLFYACGYDNDFIEDVLIYLDDLAESFKRPFRLSISE